MGNPNMYGFLLHRLVPLAFAASLICAAQQCLAVSVASFPTSGNPFAVLVTRDSQYVFVSVTNVGGPNYSTPDSEAGKRHGVVSGIQIFRNADGQLQPIRFIRLGSKGANGMAFLPGEKTIVLAAGDEGLVFVDVASAIKGEVKPYVLSQGVDAGSWDVAVMPDGKYIFSANEYGQFRLQRGNIGVVAIKWDPEGRLIDAHTIRRIPAGNKVPSLALSPDASRLYVVREIRPHAAVPIFAGMNNPLLMKHNCVQIKGTPPGPNGLLTVIDVNRAITQPSGESAIIAEIAAGCSPVRVIETRDGSAVYVTARGDDRVLSFDTKLLESDTEHGFLRALDTGGTAPVGLGFVDDEKRLIVTNSNRFGGDAGGISILSIGKATTPAAIQKIPSGDFPRNIFVAPDGNKVFVTNYTSRTLEILTFHPSPDNLSH